MICAVRSWRLLILATVVTLSALSLRIDRVRSAELAIPEASSRNPPDETRSTTDSVIIHGRREREVKEQISKYVSGAVFSYLNDSLERWNRPICPLVAGLPQERGEFILARISQIAKDSHAPLGPEQCEPNLFIVVTDNPDVLLEKWTKRDRHMLNTCNGMGYVKEFLHSRQPVRVYYNARFSTGGADRGLSALELPGVQLNLPFPECLGPGTHSRLTFGAVQEMTSVIIVVDSRQTTHLNMGQLADYLGMVGLAQIHVNANTGTAPTILHLFQRIEPRVQGLTLWDRAFLQSLYTTDQASVLEVITIKRRMFEQIIGR